jgi:hypothetical protein
VTKIGLWLVAGASVLGCSGARTPPSGPAPEYERPILPPWDSGQSSDPLDQIEGEEVTDEPRDVADAGTVADDSGA